MLGKKIWFQGPRIISGPYNSYEYIVNDHRVKGIFFVITSLKNDLIAHFQAILTFM